MSQAVFRFIHTLGELRNSRASRATDTRKFAKQSLLGATDELLGKQNVRWLSLRATDIVGLNPSGTHRLALLAPLYDDVFGRVVGRTRPAGSASSQRSPTVVVRRFSDGPRQPSPSVLSNAANHQAYRGATGYDVRAHTHMIAETYHTHRTALHRAVRPFHAPGGCARPHAIYLV